MEGTSIYASHFHIWVNIHGRDWVEFRIWKGLPYMEVSSIYECIYMEGTGLNFIYGRDFHICKSLPYMSIYTWKGLGWIPYMEGTSIYASFFHIWVYMVRTGLNSIYGSDFHIWKYFSGCSCLFWSGPSNIIIGLLDHYAN